MGKKCKEKEIFEKKRFFFQKVLDKEDKIVYNTRPQTERP